VNALEQALDKLKQTGSVDLIDIKRLNIKKLETFAEEIQFWCLYGNGNSEKLGNHRHH
jgi:hypothetical protein